MKIYVILAIAGIAFLYGLSLYSSPPNVHLYDLGKYEGREVTIEGKIINIIGNVIELREGNYTAYVYSWNNGYEYGDEIRVVGNVDEKNGNLMVYAREIKVLHFWNDSTLSLPYLAENFMEYTGCKVKIEGYIHSSYSSYFYLVDENNEYRIKVYYSCQEFKRFQHVIVEGILKYNSHRMEFYVEGTNVE